MSSGLENIRKERNIVHSFPLDSALYASLTLVLKVSVPTKLVLIGAHVTQLLVFSADIDLKTFCSVSNLH